MKKALSRIVSLLLVLCLVTALVPAVFAADENEVQILFLDTSDVHGQQFATDYTQDASLSGTHYQSMTRVATYVKEQRAEYKNVFLSDSGDTFQFSGTSQFAMLGLPMPMTATLTPSYSLMT